MVMRPEFQHGRGALVCYSDQDIEEVKGVVHLGKSDSGGHWMQGIQGELKVAEIPVLSDETVVSNETVPDPGEVA
jgi:hypothetical protein